MDLKSHKYALWCLLFTLLGILTALETFQYVRDYLNYGYFYYRGSSLKKDNEALWYIGAHVALTILWSVLAIRNYYLHVKGEDFIGA